MVDAFRSMLDELMGKERDAPLHERSGRKINFTDSDVCKYELVSLCPNQLFKNTKSDLGSCGFGVHADHLDWAEIKAEWDRLDEPGKERYGYERDLMRYMEQLVRDMDRKIEKNKERAVAESRPKPVRPDDQRKLDEIKTLMDECLQRSQELGEAGDVDASMAMMQQAEVHKRQHEQLHRQLTQPDRSMAVCDICGVFILSTDNEQRRLDHLTGKQYLGWKKIRETYAELVAKRGKDGGGQDGGGRHDGSSERSRSRGDEPRPGSRDERVRDGGRHDEWRRSRSRSPGRRGRDYHGWDRGYDRGHEWGHDRGYDPRGYEWDRGHERGRGYERGGLHGRDRGYDRSYDRGRGYHRDPRH